MFPGLDDTYTVPQDMDDLESIDAVAAPYDEFATYAVGDYCSRGGNFYRCTTAIPSGETWNANHWQETTVGEKLEELKSITGSGSLSGFAATDLTGAANELKTSLTQLTTIKQVTDCNDATEQNRVYYCDSNALHSPSATWYLIRPLYRNGEYVIQLATEMNTTNPNLYIRSKDNSGWYSWTPLHKTGTTTKYGETSINSISAGTIEDKTISYGMTFPSVPEVFLQEYIDSASQSLENAKTKLYVLDRTTAQFTVRLFNDASISRGARFRWMATL